MKRIDILTIFPGMFEPVLNESIIKRACRKKAVDIRVHDLRAYTEDKRKTVDDKPFGGGPGMVLKVEPIYRAVTDITGKRSRRKASTVLLTPRGQPYDQRKAQQLAKLDRILLICGHYEGIDERVSELCVDQEISIGDYILTCGELPAMVLIDSVVRLIPGVLGDERSNVSESFENGMLEYPQYTRPAEFKGLRVPGILLSGDHVKIEQWRKSKARTLTRRNRPDLLNQMHDGQRKTGQSHKGVSNE